MEVDNEDIMEMSFASLCLNQEPTSATTVITINNPNSALNTNWFRFVSNLPYELSGCGTVIDKFEKGVF
ncbi:hypothetical protein CASFOL_005248 [Castilleja foliolosa]|uniref:Uncharacterized protein n=1 Tax=Castilleja foliolosa TaxID=1961234 RepID=A0ABD3E2V4_9LAMI